MEEMMVESLEAPEVQETETVVEETSGETPTESHEQTTADGQYSPKDSTDYAKWLKGLRDQNPDDPIHAKHVRRAKDNEGRVFQINQVEPRGVAGVRETYAALNSLQHGELKGIEAFGAIQDELRSVSEIDERLFSGDAAALSEMGEEFVQQALPKLAGPILDMVRQANPEAYQSAVLPHFVEALRGSELVQNFNGLVDVLNEQMPNWLPEDKKAAWAADKMQRVVALAGNMGNWFNTQQQKAGQLKPVDPTKANGSKGLNEERQTFEKERQEHHWKTNISPNLDKHAATTFSTLFQPYGQRLKLDAVAKNGLMMEFSKRVSQNAAKNPAYMAQIQRYHAQKNPDPGAVVNFAKVEFDKHAKNVMKALIEERYKPFLTGKPGNSTTNQGNKPANGQNRSPVAPGVKIVAVKPAFDQIDHKGTPTEWFSQKKYKMKDGSIVQVRQ